MRNRNTSAFSTLIVLLSLLLVSLVVAACGGSGEETSAAAGSAEATTLAAGDVQGVPVPVPAAGSVQGCSEGRWCSSLYPATWSADDAPDSAGRFLHDFSYAGYRYGAVPPSAPPGATYDVVAHGADPSGGADSTAAIQAAIAAAAAAGGGVVFFPAGTFRIDEMLRVTTSGIVLRGTGTSSVLQFTKAAGMADKAHLTFEAVVAREAVRTLAVDAPARAKELFLTDASGLAPGDDVAVGWTISPSFTEEHGMTGTWTAFANEYKPFFRSKVVAVDTGSSPHRVVLDVPLRYPAKMRDGAALQKESGYLREVGVERLGITNAVTWDAAWADNRVNAITMRGVTDAWIRDVHSVAAGGATGRTPADKTVYHLRSGGVLIEDAKRVSVTGSTMQNPQNRGSGGNGYLFEVSRTSEVLIADSVARGGRHNFIQNWGFGNSGTVFLRCTSSGSEMLSLIRGELTPEPAYSEHHHSLAMATLVDDCQIDDGFVFENRGAYSTGAGHTATGSVVWGASGTGKVRSKQYGWGYVIGTEGVVVETGVDGTGGGGTAPEDFVEGRERGATLFPASLYEDQRVRRLAKPSS